MRSTIILAVLLAAPLFFAGCGSTGIQRNDEEVVAEEGRLTSLDRPQYPSTYQRRDYPPVVIRNATILTGTGDEIENGSIYLRDGVIVAVGESVDAPDDVQILEAGGKYVTPGLIDTHSHLGVYAAPGTWAENDGNEYPVAPNTAHVWAEHSFWPQDPQIPLAVAGGVTTIQVLPGSANLFGGRGVTLRLVPARGVQEMKFPGAPHTLKMACGENPKRVYGQRGGPATRMGNMAGYRSAFIAAERYQRDWDEWLKEREGNQPERDLGRETLAGVLKGDIIVQNHCYRADEMLFMLDLAREFGFEIRSFHHAVEAYKIADKLADAGVSASIWADWWGFKEEAMDAILENASLLHTNGVTTIIHSDDPQGIQRLNQEAAKAMYAGRRAGMDIPGREAIRWITANAALALGIDDVTGTLEPGKAADVVVWSGDPFSVYSVAEKVFNEGWLIYNVETPDQNWFTDFELDQVKR